MSETMFYILFALRTERHGYGVMQHVEELTEGRIVLGAGTVYTSLGKLEADGLVTVTVGNARLTALEQDLPSGTRDVYVCIRAEEVILMKGEEGQTSPRNRLAATVKLLTREGPVMRVDLDCGFPLVAFVTRQACEELALQEKDRVMALIKAPQIHLIPRAAPVASL